MRRVKRLFLLLLLVLGLTGCSKITASGKDTESSWKNSKDGTSTFLAGEFEQLVSRRAGTGNCYEAAYFTCADQLLEEQKKADDFGIDHPLFVLNPYGTTPGMVYMYLGEWKERPYISYQVRVAGIEIPEYSRNFYVPAGLYEETGTQSYPVEGLLTGLLEGVTNEVLLTVRNEAGTVLSQKKYTIDLRNQTLPRGIEQVILGQKTENSEAAGEGLFCCTLSLPEENGYFFYDNNGILRARIHAGMMLEYGKLLEVGNHIFCASGYGSYVLLDSCGRVTARFQLDENEIMQDYVYDPDAKQIIVLVETGRNAPLRLYAIDLKEYETRILLNFEENDPFDYVDQELRGSQVTMKVIEEGDILLAGSQTNCVFRVNHLYTQPAVRWTLQSGNGAEHILSLSGTMPVYQGISSISQYTATVNEEDFALGLLAKTEDQAWFQMIVIDEKLHIYTQLGRLCLGTSAELLSAHTYGNHIVSGKSGKIEEYDQEGRLLLTLTLKQPAVRRVQKMTMSRYWF